MPHCKYTYPVDDYVSVYNTMKYFSVPLGPQKEIVCKGGGRIPFLSRFLHFLASYIYFLVFHPSWWGPSRILTNVSFTTAAKFDWALRSSGSRANWLINYTHLGFIFYICSSIYIVHNTCAALHISPFLNLIFTFSCCFVIRVDNRESY